MLHKVRHKHFRKGDLKLKCLATIAQLYWRSNEASMEGDRIQRAPVLGRRETFNLGQGKFLPTKKHAWAYVKITGV